MAKHKMTIMEKTNGMRSTQNFSPMINFQSPIKPDNRRKMTDTRKMSPKLRISDKDKANIHIHDYSLVAELAQTQLITPKINSEKVTS